MFLGLIADSMKQNLERKEKENGANDKVRFFIHGIQNQSLERESSSFVLLGSHVGDFNG